MPCFILYAQIVSMPLRYTFNNDKVAMLITRLLQNEEGRIRLDMKITDTFYGLFSMQNVLRYLLDHCCCQCLKFPSETGNNHSVNTAVVPSATHPLIQPTSTEVSYDSCTITM